MSNVPPLLEARATFLDMSTSGAGEREIGGYRLEGRVREAPHLEVFASIPTANPHVFYEVYAFGAYSKRLVQELKTVESCLIRPVDEFFRTVEGVVSHHLKLCEMSTRPPDKVYVREPYTRLGDG